VDEDVGMMDHSVSILSDTVNNQDLLVEESVWNHVGPRAVVRPNGHVNFGWATTLSPISQFHDSKAFLLLELYRLDRDV
jgi:hypothetical protein